MNQPVNSRFSPADYAAFDCQQHKAQAETHPVFNQPTALENFNTYTSDVALQYWVNAFGGDWADEQLTAYGVRCGGDLIEAGFQANENKPKFYPHDRFGNRVDLAKFHPAYHQLMRTAIEAEMHALPWTHARAGAHVARAGMVYQHMNADAGSGCPLTMTFAAVPALQHAPSVAKEWLPKIMAPVYDERNVPYFEKQGVTIGMAMTEKQGGSDVRANTTRAYAVGDKTGNGGEYEIVGHKWFCSAPMCDAFLVLAHTESGLSCFLLPRWRPDGSKNQMYVQRLKDKLGNISNASSEVEFRGAFAWMLGDEGRGVRTIIEMVSMTRFDCMIGSAALMRGALAQAIHHTSGRSAFGKNLHEQPLMQNVLADLAIESEAALAITMRVGHALDNLSDEHENLFARLATAVGKYWICKRAPHFAYEAMECIGGVAYVEDNILPRIYREAPVNAIWEGSGNVQCLDVLRAMSKEPAVVDAFFNELKKAVGKYPQYDQFLLALQAEFKDVSTLEYRSRTVVDKLAVALQACVLIEKGDAQIADAFVRSRIARNGAFNYGTLETGIDCYSIMKRAQPAL
ncbi:acyl-CoA dehydrogenase family protein [Thalassolituus sp. LLYu03]|uniref:acyl-CoA dehydrogenase family protein n=1 Tax=Thalassolituus sp. LLYu03 TaxID=3421656 RepID=UPI003D287F89